jgi:tyrosinase
MKLVNLINLWLLSDIVQCQKPEAKCTNPRRRPEIRELTQKQLKDLFDAMKKLRNSQDKKNNWDSLVKIHIDAKNTAHGVPLFLPWHRYFLRLFEKMLQQINPSIMLPYWNWSKDSQAPERSIVFTEEYFGKSGGWEDCINTGQFSWTYSNVPNAHCIKRRFNKKPYLTAFYSPEALEIMIDTSASYNEFYTRIGGAPHASIHESIGGEVGDLYNTASPNDPIFWLHHCFLDMLWWNWQKRNRDMGMDYGGSSDATYFQKIAPWNANVYSVLNTTTSGEFCYYYDKWEVPTPMIMPKFNDNDTNRAEMRSIKKSIAKTEISVNIKKSKTETWSIKGLNELMLQIANGEVKTKKVDPLDRILKNKIRSPSKISEKTMKIFKLDPKQVDETEEIFDLVGQAFNALEDFTPSAEL